MIQKETLVENWTMEGLWGGRRNPFFRNVILQPRKPSGKPFAVSNSTHSTGKVVVITKQQNVAHLNQTTNHSPKVGQDQGDANYYGNSMEEEADEHSNTPEEPLHNQDQTRNGSKVNRFGFLPKITTIPSLKISWNKIGKYRQYIREHALIYKFMIF